MVATRSFTSKMIVWRSAMGLATTGSSAVATVAGRSGGRGPGAQYQRESRRLEQADAPHGGESGRREPACDVFERIGLCGLRVEHVERLEARDRLADAARRRTGQLAQDDDEAAGDERARHLPEQLAVL